MTYTFKNTERNNEKASNFETKSLLYLIGQRKDCKDVIYVTFDCFNDVSGLNRKFNKIWDVQSKNEKSLNPKKIGKYFFTLFKNYIHPFSFEEFIFFCPQLKSEYKIDASKVDYDLSNIVDKTYKSIKNGLLEEIERVEGSVDSYSKQVEDFLKKVLIVEDNILESEYIKAITKFKNTSVKNNEFYQALFIELRDIQTVKKNSCIENVSISDIRDVLKFQRFLSVRDIDTLIISRIVGAEIFGLKPIPLYFSPFTEGMEINDKRDLLQECNSNLSRAFFNKNATRSFWSICEMIIEYCNQNSNHKNAEEIYNILFTNYNFRVSYLNKNTVLYLISIIIEGLE